MGALISKNTFEVRTYLRGGAYYFYCVYYVFTSLTLCQQKGIPSFNPYFLKSLQEEEHVKELLDSQVGNIEHK